ncbi:MAG TPA: DUF3800 domain-containing protein [Thermoanaerobaculia bacterium]|nr:DUF3800 domain-containing protein [Thermoanaerobaculia bacterium]
MEKKRFRLYVDESGDHTFTLADDDNHRYLGLLGIWFDSDTPYKEFAKALAELKREIFGWHPDDPPVSFHRKDILGRKGIFVRLRDPEVNQRFGAGLLQVIRDARFCMTCVVIDKAVHRTKTYRELFHPYHYCLATLLERYTGWLSQVGAEGDVVAESRGRNEDHELLEAFETTLQRGTRFHEPQGFQQVLTSTKIKLKKKEHAIPGLELADLLAYPFKREMVAERRGEQPPEDFSATLLDAARPKMNCQPSTGRVVGYGKVWLD